MASSGVLLAVSAALCLLNGILCQVVEQPLNCSQSSNNCSGGAINLPYSKCCATGSESFKINGTCYACAELISFSASSYTVQEGADFINVEVRRSVNPGTNHFFFSTIVTDDSAEAGIDYGQFPDPGIGYLNIMLEDESWIGSAIIILDDSLVEHNENFTVSLLHLSRDLTPLGNPTDHAVVTIIDDDQVDITLTPSGPVGVVEPSPVLTFFLNKTGEAARSVSVVVDLSDPELVFSDGNLPDNRIITFAPNEDFETIEIRVPDDNIVEATENHNIVLRVPVGETGVNLPQDTVTVVVEDDDSLTVTLEVSEVRATEVSGSAAVTIRKIGANERSVFVRVFTEAVSAEGGADFTPVDMEVEFLPGVDEFNVEVNVSNDGIVEDEESFLIRLDVPLTEKAVILERNTTTVFLEDSNFILVSVDSGSVSVTEGGEVELTVMVAEGVLARSVVLDISLSPGGTQDITISATTLTLSGSNLNNSIVITGVDDEFYEGVESVDLMITSSDRAVMPSILTVSIDIEDNESPQLSFSEMMYSFSETAGVGEILVTFGALTETTHTWILTSVPLTATEGEDYSPINTTLTFNNDERNRRVLFDIIDDLISDGLERFRLELRDREGNIQNDSLVEIVDDEKLLISFTGSSFTVSEDERIFTLEVTKSGVTTSDIRVTINFTDITAVGGSDYGFFPTPEFLALTLILANETRVYYHILITDDNIVENVESFSANLLLKNNDGTIILGNISGALIFIEDNDRVAIFLTLIGDGMVAEGGTVGERTVQFIVSRDENATLDRDITVVLSTSDGTALDPRDYVHADFTFLFIPLGVNSFGASILVLDDQTVESTEVFSVSLSAPSDSSAVELPENATIISIIDDDKIRVDFSEPTYTVTEGEPSVVIFLNKTGDNEIPVMVSVETRTIDDTATAGSDYNSTIQPLEFQATETRLPLNIPIVDDNILENTESFTVILTVAVEDSNVVLGPGNITRVTILDNDNVSVEFSEATYRVREDGGSVSVTVVLSGAAQRDVLVEVFTTDDSADAGDYIPLRETLTFFPGDTEKTLRVSILRDDMCEDLEEKFSVNLLSSDTSVLVGRVGSSTVVITEDRICGLGFMNDSISVIEPESQPSPLRLCVVRDADIDRDIELAVVAEEIRDIPIVQQALAGVDFILRPTVLTLPSTDDKVCFDVTIRNDDRPEEPEMFSVVVIPEPGVTATQSGMNVTIIDPDFVLPTVEFSAASYSVMETAGVVAIELVISRPAIVVSQRPVSVVFSTADGTATSPDDYTAQIGTLVTFEPTQTSSTVTVVITVDNIPEDTESFSVSLSLPVMRIARVALGDVTEATVTITEIEDEFANDTVVGDPLFVVPLSLTSDSHQFDEQPSLCFEIHGMTGSFFNLVSDDCTSVNALYEVNAINKDLNFISEIGVKAVNLRNECVTVRVPVDTNCVPEIRQGDEAIMGVPRYEDAGVAVRRSGTAVRVSVPNCANSRLVMWIMCRNTTGQLQLRFDITRGLNLKPTSHGLLGQFWNIPIRVLPFTFIGQVTYDFQRQELYRVEVRPENSQARVFVAEYYPISWDQSRPEPCLYAGDQQGGRSLEIKNPNDPVIENNYRLYRTDSLFATKFRFSQFEAARCGG